MTAGPDANLARHTNTHNIDTRQTSLCEFREHAQAQLHTHSHKFNYKGGERLTHSQSNNDRANPKHTSLLHRQPLTKTARGTTRSLLLLTSRRVRRSRHSSVSFSCASFRMRLNARDSDSSSGTPPTNSRAENREVITLRHSHTDDSTRAPHMFRQHNHGG